jgi:hypothetical protein
VVRVPRRVREKGKRRREWVMSVRDEAAGAQTEWGKAVTQQACGSSDNRAKTHERLSVGRMKTHTSRRGENGAAVASLLSDLDGARRGVYTRRARDNSSILCAM